MNNRTIKYYLGVDAGGTSCRVRLETVNGQVLGEGNSGPATIRLGGEASAASIMAATRKALVAGGLDETILSDTLACVGIASSEIPGSKEDLTENLQPFGLVSPIVISDAHTACVGAHAGADGGIVIAGTGAIGYGLVGGHIRRVGGHGFPAGDEGSGAFIGLRAVQLALNAADGLIASTDLSDELYSALGGTSVKVADWLATANATHFAALAPIIVKTDTDQSRAILREAAEKIGHLVLGLNRKGVERIALIGGIAGVVKQYLPDAAHSVLVEPIGSPVDGAIEMCRQSAGTSRITMPSSTPK